LATAKVSRPFSTASSQCGATLIEVIVFIVVLNLALVAVLQIYGQAVVNSVDPVVRVKATELARSTLDDVLAKRFDESTPSGGIPACGTTAGDACTGIVNDSDYDDVGDFNGYVDNSDSRYPVSVTVANAGADLGIANSLARKITVTVGMPDGNQVTLAGYKANY
jgi:MSHA pilin protein MshD